ncbi:GM20410 [Drosophila sechellia]|uniref:GM20410 n=1 Tax=Drosophila sechellia TaxID=7238 RepID=B4HNT0_DROSE|nr:GM20410 [Drosophila sechellia]
MAPGQDAEHMKGARSTGNRFMVLDKDVDMDMGLSGCCQLPRAVNSSSYIASK